MKKMAKIFGAELGLVGGGVFATWAMANAKNRNINVPASSDIKAVVWFLGVSGKNPITAPVRRNPDRGLVGMLKDTMKQNGSANEARSQR